MCLLREVLSGAARIFEKAHLNLALSNRLIENRGTGLPGRSTLWPDARRTLSTRRPRWTSRNGGRILSLAALTAGSGKFLLPISISSSRVTDEKITMDLRAGRGALPSHRRRFFRWSWMRRSPHGLSQEQLLSLCGQGEKQPCFWSRSRFTPALTGGASLTAEGRVSRDNFSARELTCGYYLFALSDGMGSGWQANRRVRRRWSFEQFAEAQFGYGGSAAARERGYGAWRSQERYSTPGCVRGWTGTPASANFYKVGGTCLLYPAQIRGGGVVAEENLPICAAEQLDTMPLERPSEDGDISCHDHGWCRYLKGDARRDILGGDHLCHPGTDPNASSKRAPGGSARTEGKIYDDMTVPIIRAWET